MKTILLTQGQEALVDDADWEWLIDIPWHVMRTREGEFYACHTLPKRTIMMHRAIMKPPKNKQVDHIDGNKLNNQRHNLRICTRAENLRNQRTKRKYKGMTYYKGAYDVRVQGKYIGRWKDHEEAARAYDREALRVFGEFARLNFPEDK